MKLSEVFFILFFMGGLLIPAALIQQWWLFGTFAIFFAVFICVEGLAVLVTKKTVSKHFWEYSRENKGKAIAVLISMQIAWIALLLHLAEKMW